MPLLDDPVPRRTGLLLREAVRRLVIAERPRRFAPVLHVGRPGVREWSAAAPVAGTDHALRSDLAAALLHRAGEGPHLAWLTRPGALLPHDADAAWLAAVLAAAAESGRDPSFVVVTRQGWYDPRSGLRRTWVRLRP